MPALAQALSGALPEAALRQLMQSLGNCQQPLTHRGAINIQPTNVTGANGLARTGTWRPSDYTGLLPSAGDNVFVDMAGNSYNDTTNSNNYDGHQFHFPINQDFNYSNYYGGDTFNVAGNSTFDNSTVNTLTAGDTNIQNLTVKNIYYTGGGDEGGGGDGGGGMNPGGGGGGIFPIPFGPGGGGGGIPIPAVNAVSTFMKDVTVRGTVVVPTTETATVRDKFVQLTNSTSAKTVTVSGEVSVPTVESATLSSFGASGTATLPTVTGVSMTGATASGSISYDTYPTATCAPLSGTVTLPTSGTFSTTPTGIAVSSGLGSLAGTVTIPMPTGGYLDASCKLVLTTTNQTYNVSFTGAPSASVSSQGTVSGSVTLSGSTTATVTIGTPSISMSKTTASATANLSVSGGTFTVTAGTTTTSVSVSGATAKITLVGGSVPLTVASTGTVTVNEVTAAALKDDFVTLKAGTVTQKLNLTVAKKSDFIIYLRPRL